MSARVLVVDDEASIRESLKDLLEDEGFLVGLAASGEEAVAWLQRYRADCVLLDIWLPGIDGVETLARIRTMDPDLPVIVMSGHATIDAAVETTRKGAFDFLEKPLATERLLVQVRNAVAQRRLHTENRALREHARARPPEVVAVSPAMREVLGRIEKAAAAHAPVLLIGEHGTGKSLLARHLHARSPRAGHPFACLHHADLADDRAEARLFGAGADGREPGALALAHRGTLFLDGLDHVPVPLQARLAHALRTRRVRAADGSSREVDVRAVASVSEDPAALLRAGRLDEETYYFFAVVEVRVPPLRERAEDIPALVAHFAALHARELGRAPVRFADDAMARLAAHAWPGNVRELANYVEQCAILFDGGETITADTMPPLGTTGGEVVEMHATFREARERFERAYLLRHLERCGWNISRTARAIGMERSQLHRKLQQLGITPPGRAREGA